MAGNKAKEIHMVLSTKPFGDYGTACGHIYGPLRVTTDEDKVTCGLCRRCIKLREKRRQAGRIGIASRHDGICQ